MGAKHRMIPYRAFKLSNGVRPVMTRRISCNQRKQITFILNAEIKTQFVMQSTSQHSTIRWKAFTCIFFQNFFRVFPVLAVANTCSCVGLQNKLGHPAHHYRHLMQVPVLSARGIWIGSETCVIVFLGLRFKIVDVVRVVVFRKRDLRYHNLWDE